MSVFGEFLQTLLLALCTGILAYWVLAHIIRDDPQIITRWGALLAGHRIDGLLFLVVGLFVMCMSVPLVMRYLSLASSRDLAQFDQLVWNSMRGRLLENTFVTDAPLFLGKSFVPILLAFVPLYAVWSNPLILSIGQAVAFASGAFPIYWFARRELGRALAIGVAIAYLLSPTVVNSTLLEFHEIALATPLLCYATFFLLRRNYMAFLVTLGVTLLVKEEIAFVVIAFGVYLFLFQGQRRLGLALAGFGLVWGAFLLQYAIPFFQSSRNFYYFSSGSLSGGAARYGYLGSSFSEILTTLVTRPDIFLPRVVTMDKIAFLLHLLVPLLFLSLAGAEVAFLGLPTLGYTLLSTYPEQYSIQTYYVAPLVPFLFFAAILGLERLVKRFPSGAMKAAWRGALLAMLLAASISSYQLHTLGPLARWYQFDEYTNNRHATLGRTLLRSIPENAAVIAQDDFLTHLSERQFVYEIPLIPDYRQADYLVADRTREWYKVHQTMWEHYLAIGYFDVISDEDGYLIAKRRSPIDLVEIRFGDQMDLAGYTILPTGSLVGGMTLRPTVEWRALRQIAQKYRISAEVTDDLGHVWAVDDHEPQGGNLPTNQWQTDKGIGDQYTLKLPPTMPSGNYQFSLAVYLPEDNGNSYLQGMDPTGNSLGQDVVLDSFKVEKNKSSLAMEQLEIEQPLIVDFGEMRLLGYVPPREKLNAGELLQVGLYWRAREKPRGDYSVVIQLRGADGRSALERASRPAADTYATTQWDAGEVLLDWHDFNIPTDIPIGKYTIVVSMRDAVSGKSMGEATIAMVQVVK